MAFTYNAAQLSTSTLFRARLEIGDVVENQGALPGGKNLSDEEITYILSTESEHVLGVARLFDLLAARWSSQPDYSLGPVSEKPSQVAGAFRARAKEYREKSQHIQGAAGIPTVPSDGVNVDRWYSHGADTKPEDYWTAGEYEA